MKKIVEKINPYVFARFSLFIIYVWFGILKPLMLSHANPLVENLLQHTFLSFIPVHTFFILFGIFEVIIGFLTLCKKCTKLFAILVIVHLITTVLPLFILPLATWSAIFVPTLVGQYIMKNLAILALVFFLLKEEECS